MKLLVVFLLFLICFSAALFGTSLYVLENPPLDLAKGDDSAIAGILTFGMWIASFVTGAGVLFAGVQIGDE